MNKRLIQLFRAKLGAIQTKASLPWEVSQPGVYYSRAWVDDEKFGTGNCNNCGQENSPLVASTVAQDGILHCHRRTWDVTDRLVDRFSSDGREIYNMQGVKIAGNYDYEMGGIVDPSMTKLLVWIVNHLPALLDEIEKSEPGSCNLPSKMLESGHEQATPHST